MIKTTRVLRLLITISLSILLFTACSDKETDLLRSGEAQVSYIENNKEASKRFSRIMYHTDEDGNQEELFKIVHISDPHISKGSHNNHVSTPHNLVQSVQFANQNNLKVNAMIATGDFISDAKRNDALTALKSFSHHFFTNNKLPSFICTGNHDANIYWDNSSHYISSAEMYPILTKANPYPGLKKVPNTNYSYGDVKNPQGGYIRFISLDMLDNPTAEYDFLHYVVYSQKQIDWLINVALKEGTTDEHHVIILNHYPFQPLSGDKGNFLINGEFAYSWRLIPEIIEAYRGRTSLQKRYPDRFFPDREINVDMDFSEYKGDFICHLGGHAHSFALFDILNIENLNPSLSARQKMILCTNQDPADASNFFTTVVRKANTVTSNCFNLYAIDTYRRKIFITFFGMFKPVNEPNFPEIIEFEY